MEGFEQYSGGGGPAPEASERWRFVTRAVFSMTDLTVGTGWISGRSGGRLATARSLSSVQVRVIHSHPREEAPCAGCLRPH